MLIEVDDGRFTAVTHRRRRPPAGAVRLPGLTLPGLANAHSHAFHRALRGRTHGGTRHVLDLARADVPRGRPARPGHATTRWPGPSYAEMALAGITCVGEFHYLHHGAGRHARTPTRTRWATR